MRVSAQTLGRITSPTIYIDNVYPSGYIISMVEIRKTENFAKWIDGLNDQRARARILVRIERLAA